MYAATDDVLLRAGRYAGVFQVAGKRPNVADLDKLLVDTAAEIDAVLRAHGFDPATLSAAVKAALLDLNAYGALARALASLTGDTALASLRAEALETWTAGMAALETGAFPALAELEAEGGGATAGNFWTDEPSYGTYPLPVAFLDQQTGDGNPRLSPAFVRGMSF